LLPRLPLVRLIKSPFDLEGGIGCHLGWAHDVQYPLPHCCHNTSKKEGGEKPRRFS
jgi:hypothetical protein